MKNLNYLLILLTSSFALSQSHAIDWDKKFGGIGYDMAKLIQKTNEGGYFITGSSNSNNGDVTGNHGEEDFWLLKTNVNGDIEWQKSLGGSGYDIANSGMQTLDGGYIVVGDTFSSDGDVSFNNGHADYWVVKLDNNGHIEWEKSLGGSQQDIGLDIKQTLDGGFIISGYTYSSDGDITENKGNTDAWIVKLDNLGNIEWEKSYGGSSYDGAASIIQTNDGGYIFAGSSESTDGDLSNNYGKDDTWIVKLDASGEILWEKSLGGSGYDYPAQIVQTNDNGYVVVGVFDSSLVFGGINSPWIFKLDESGNLQWERLFGSETYVTVQSIQQTNDEGFFITGFNGGNQAYIFKTDLLGNLEWQELLVNSSDDVIYSGFQTPEGGFIIAGGSESEIYPNVHHDLWIRKISANLFVQDFDLTQISIYPNPTKDNLNFSEKVKEINVYDLSGKIVKTKKGASFLTLDISVLPKGTYIIKGITESGKKITNKVIKE